MGNQKNKPRLDLDTNMFKESDFQNLLKKLAMTLSDAYAILELPDNTKDEALIKKNFKKLTLKYHPDLGGSHEKMVQLNQAKDRIDLSLKGKDTSSYFWTPQQQPQNREDIRKQWEQKKQQKDESEKKTEQELQQKLEKLKKIVLSKKNDYLKHLENIFGSIPRFFIKEKVNVGYYNGAFIVDFKFKFETGTECSLYINYSSTHNTYHYKSDLYYENKLYKMQKSNYTTTPDIDFFSNPKNLFPQDKLSKLLKTTTPKTFKRKDAEAMLVKEVFAKKVDETTWKIPIDETHFVYIIRQVFMKHGTWIVNGLYEKYRRIAVLPSGYPRTYFETLESEENNFLELIKFLKDAKNNKINW